MVRAAAESPEHFERRPRVRITRGANRVFARGFHRLDVLSPCRLPARGPAILVCNHTSGLDPVLIQSACKRVIVWMMASEYYDSGALGWFFRMLHAIPVDRSGRDLAATRQALRMLEDGHVLGIFPEGRIEPDRRLLPFQTGVAMMASRTRVPVYPSYLDGTQRRKSMLRAFLEPQEARIAFGPAVAVAGTPRPDVENATDRIEKAVSALQSTCLGNPGGKNCNKNAHGR